MTLRRLTQDDAPALRSLWARGLRENPDAFLLEEQELLAIPDAQFAASIAQGTFLGHFENDQLVGYLVARQGSVARLRHTADIGPLYVDPAYQRRGIARALMLATLDALKAQGLLQTELTVDAANAPARALYESLGFKPFGCRPRSVFIDGTPRTDLMMIKALDGHDLTPDLPRDIPAA